jgi:hypothetical protein
MLVQGDEQRYGVGNVERFYAKNWSEITTVCLGRGELYDWLRQRGRPVELVEGLAKFTPRCSTRALAELQNIRAL